MSSATDRPASAGDAPTWLLVSCWTLLVVAVVIVTTDFITTWHQPILEEHGFRQTQTALTSYWLLHGGPWLAYDTPVIGAPWSVPFEFPLFQMIVAATARLTSLPLDESGRLVAFAFYLATPWTFFRLARLFEWPKLTSVIAAALFVLSPEYRFWGRAFMIESCALFLSLLYLVLVVTALRARDTAAVSWWVAAVATGVLAALVKVTTFAAFLGVAGLVSIGYMVAGRHGGWRLALNAAALGAPVVAMHAWTRFTDALKALNPIGRSLVSDRLVEWNFGSLAQRLDAETWAGVIWGRATAEAIGPVSAAVAVVFAMLWTRGRDLRAAIALVGLWLSVFMVFTNLHTVHNYYQYANSIFLIGAVAIVTAASARTQSLVAVTGFLVILGAQQVEFTRGYAERMTADIRPETSRTLAITQVLRERTDRDAAIVAYGFDWSSEVAYYSERRALTVPDWDRGMSLDILENPMRYLGDRPLGGVVVCPEAATNPEFEAALERLTREMARVDTSGCRVFVHPDRNHIS